MKIYVNIAKILRYIFDKYKLLLLTINYNMIDIVLFIVFQKICSYRFPHFDKNELIKK